MKSVVRHIEKDKKRFARLEKKGSLYSRQVAEIVKKRNYEKPESALAIPGDTKYQASLKRKLAPFKKVKHLILIGIGGSSLGAEAIYNALAYKTNPQLHVLDAIEKDTIEKFKECLKEVDDLESFAVVVASKSGTTSETLVNGVQALEFAVSRFGKGTEKRFIFIGTDGSAFLKQGKKKGVLCITFPDSIGGRFSVFSAVGIVPLLLLRIDTVSLCEGAVDALSTEARKESQRHAEILAVLAEKGFHTVNFFTFNGRLTQLGYWYRQLLAESIGKSMTKHKTTFCHQLLPTVSTSVDLHSMAQLYLGGYRGMYTHFLSIDADSDHHKLTDHWLLDHTPMLKHKAPSTVKNAIREGVERAYDDQKLPYRTTVLKKLTAYEIGYLMTSLMFEVMSLAEFLDVDAFTQPSVEAYKQYTRRLLT